MAESDPLGGSALRRKGVLPSCSLVLPTLRSGGLALKKKMLFSFLLGECHLHLKKP